VDIGSPSGTSLEKNASRSCMTDGSAFSHRISDALVWCRKTVARRLSENSDRREGVPD